MKFAFWRAIPNTGALKVHAVIHDADSDGPAYAIYAWDWTDVDPTSPGDFYDVMKTEVNERGGMIGGAVFQGIAPYPVPGYDLVWTDDSPGG